MTTGTPTLAFELAPYAGVLFDDGESTGVVNGITFVQLAG